VTERTVIMVLLWLALGLGSGLYMVRRGYDQRWIYIALVLGPLFVPIAIERVRGRPVQPEVEPVSADDGVLRVLVGYDGSEDSQAALATTSRLFGPALAELLVVQVVSYDAAEDLEAPDLEEARRHVDDAVASLDSAVAHGDVLAGPPAETLCRAALERGMDMLVIGPRGGGLADRVLGSVAEHVLDQAHLPVLVSQGPDD
jgi:nucleotide-binding universal stress UspA family protein